MIRSLSALPNPDADFALASLTMTAERASAIDYLMPIGTETDALFISSEGKCAIIFFIYILV